MKNIFLALFLVAISVNAFADKNETLRTLDCTGTVKVNKQSIAIVGRITDTKYTDEIGSEYWSTLTLTDAENPSAQFFGNLTSTDTMKDIQAQRDLPRDDEGNGVITYDLFKDKKTYDQSNHSKAERTGLLVVGAPCTAKEQPKAKKCKSPRGERNYIVQYMYGGSNVVGPDARGYEGTLNCKVNSKGISQ